MVKGSQTGQVLFNGSALHEETKLVTMMIMRTSLLQGQNWYPIKPARVSVEQTLCSSFGILLYQTKIDTQRDQIQIFNRAQPETIDGRFRKLRSLLPQDINNKKIDLKEVDYSLLNT